MTDLFDDDDLFAVRTPPVRVKAPKPAPVVTDNGAQCPASAPGVPLSYACPCGGRDEVKAPAPERVDCWSCRGLETMRRYQPGALFVPPAGAGRSLTADELRGMKLDERR